MFSVILMACKFVFEYLSVLFLQFITLTPKQKRPAPLSNEATQSTDDRVIYLISNLTSLEIIYTDNLITQMTYSKVFRAYFVDMFILCL